MKFPQGYNSKYLPEGVTRGSQEAMSETIVQHLQQQGGRMHMEQVP